MFNLNLGKMNFNFFRLAKINNATTHNALRIWKQTQVVCLF